MNGTNRDSGRGIANIEIWHSLIGCAYQVYKKLGFGFLESVYKKAMMIYYHESLERIVVLTKGTKRLPEYQVKDALRAMQALERGDEKK